MSFGHRIRIRIAGGSRAVTVEHVDGEGPTMRVQLERSQDSSSDQAQVTIFGLDEGYLAPLLTSGATCSVSAGLGRLAGLCTGRYVPGSYRDGWEGAAPIASFTLLDGRFQLRDVTVSRAWTDTDTDALWSYLVQQSGLSSGTLRPGRTVNYARGYVMARGWRAEADRLARATNSRVSIQSGVVNVWPIGETLQSRRLVLGPSQIVGFPAQVDDGRIRVATIYTGTPVNPGDTWRMSEGRHAGLWRCESTSWDLATARDVAFYMTMTGRRV